MPVPWRPRTIRMRLALLYAALIFGSGLVLLAGASFLVYRQTFQVISAPAPSNPNLPALPAPIQNVAVPPLWSAVRKQTAESLVGLAVMAAISTALGWFVARQVLSPLRTMTAKTRRISARNLHERLAVEGPRDEMTQLADTIDGLLGRLELAFQAQRRFIANASHELRTPLAMMRTSVDVATGKPAPLPKEVTVLAEKLREGLDSADQLLEGLLLLARAQNAENMEVTTVRLSELAESALAARSAAIAEKNLTVEQVGDAVAVQGNATLLASLVDNLVDNAIRHNEADGWLRITMGSESSSTKLAVENGGAILDPADVALLGQPFQRLGAERTSRAGTGLGLSIAAAVASAHAGRLVLRARPEGGLCAEVDL